MIEYTMKEKLESLANMLENYKSDPTEWGDGFEAACKMALRLLRQILAESENNSDQEKT